MTDTPPDPTRLIHLADYPNGIRCIECHTVFRDGDAYCERLEGMAGEVPVVEIVCERCGMGDGEES